MTHLLKRLFSIVATGAVALALVLTTVTPANADDSETGYRNCGAGQRVGIYSLSTGFTEHRYESPSGSFYWNNGSSQLSRSSSVPATERYWGVFAPSIGSATSTCQFA